MSTMIRQGPRASDHFTVCHNLMFRSRKLLTPTEVVVLGNVLSHEQGWSTSAEAIAAQVGISLGTAKKALHGLKLKHFIIWGQERNPDGTHGPGWYFVTDVRFQLMQAGVTDGEVIEAAVRAALTDWLEHNRRSEPEYTSCTPDEPGNSAPHDPGASANPQVDAVSEDITAGQNRSTKSRRPVPPPAVDCRHKKTIPQAAKPTRSETSPAAFGVVAADPDLFGAAAAEPVPPAVTAQTVTAAWIDAFEVNGTKPTRSLIGRASKAAKELLDAGNDPGIVLAAATAAGSKGYPTIDRELATAGRATTRRMGTADRSIAEYEAMKSNPNTDLLTAAGIPHPRQLSLTPGEDQ